ncbi:MAG: type I-B CRISPR-associated protein Cas5 [Bacilli bacterium]|nr:type I-B CRISPR-associated protein Cas5 [Bacilli bacterium]
MKLIRIKAKQNMVNYRRPMCYISGETYPLPPYSTIIGMIHNACGYKEYHPMKISVQGIPYSVVSDIQTKVAGGTAKFEKDRHNFFATCNGKKIGYTKGPGNVELITEIDLIIHIQPKNDLELEEIKNGLLNPIKYLSLGRHEDIINIIEVKIVEAKIAEEPVTKYPMYFQENENNNKLSGPIYKLKKVFKVDPKTNLRHFENHYRLHYIASNTPLYHALVDEEENVICLI